MSEFTHDDVINNDNRCLDNPAIQPGRFLNSVTNFVEFKKRFVFYLAVLAAIRTAVGGFGELAVFL